MEREGGTGEEGGKQPLRRVPALMKTLTIKENANFSGAKVTTTPCGPRTRGILAHSHYLSAAYHGVKLALLVVKNPPVFSTNQLLLHEKELF